MRKILVKYLFGRYWWKLPFQSHYNVTARGPFWYFNGYLLIALSYMLFRSNEWILLLSFPWSALVLYFGFPLFGIAYFEKHPVKWGELDNEQKWYYGQGAMSGELTKKIPFNQEQMTEWMHLNKYFREKYNFTKKV